MQQVLLAALQEHNVLYVVRLREHIHGLDGRHAVVGVEERQVAGLRGRVAADIDDALRRNKTTLETLCFGV